MKVIILAVFLIGACTAQTGTGKSTRYWDCCKPSCAWNGKGPVNAPVKTCKANGVEVLHMDTQSGCNGGTAYTCNNNQPWSKNSSYAFGFVAGKLQGQSEWDWCCACYELTFTTGPVAGQKMAVQVTNTGGDLGENHFDIQMPGGGVGLFNGCAPQWGGSYQWGAQYGGISSKSECSKLPSQVQPGCNWRFDWFKNADNPYFSFKKITCPSELTNITGCKRNS